jgi:hypothetical protein
VSLKKCQDRFNRRLKLSPGTDKSRSFENTLNEPYQSGEPQKTPNFRPHLVIRGYQMGDIIQAVIFATVVMMVVVAFAFG